MPRIRTVKPEFFRHESLQDLEASNPGAYPMLVFAGLWTVCDREGRFEWRPRQLKLDILPFLPFDMGATLELLESHGFISRYEVAGRPYGCVPTFKDHQRINGKEAEGGARCPDPTPGEAMGKQRGSTGEAPGKHPRSTWEAPEKHPGAREREREREREEEREGSSAPDKPVPAAPDPSLRDLTDWVVESWTRKYGTKPVFKKPDWVAFTEVFKALGYADTRTRWERFLADDREFYRGHTPRKFAAVVNELAKAGTSHQLDLRTLGAHTTDEPPPTRDEAERKYRARVEIALNALPAGEVRTRALADADKFAELNGIEIRREWPTKEAKQAS